MRSHLLLILLFVIPLLSHGQDQCDLSDHRQKKLSRIKDPDIREKRHQKYHTRKNKAHQQLTNLKNEAAEDGREYVNHRSEDVINKQDIINVPDDSAIDVPQFKKINSAHDQIAGVTEELNEIEDKIATIKSSSDSTVVNTMAEKSEDFITRKIEGTEEVKELNSYSPKETDPEQYFKKDVPDVIENPSLPEKNIKQKLNLIANDVMMKNIQKVQQAQIKMASLSQKYESITSTADLGTAVKRTSLKGKPLKERLFVGGNFQIQDMNPLLLDFSPFAGYKFNKLFQAGAGAHYRYMFGSKNYFSRVPSSSIGYKIFISHDVFKNFSAYTEYENQKLKSPIPETNDPLWQEAWHIGFGRSIHLNSFLTTQVLVLYNLIHNHQQLLYGRRWNVRVGIKINKTGVTNPLKNKL